MERRIHTKNFKGYSYIEELGESFWSGIDSEGLILMLGNKWVLA